MDRACCADALGDIEEPQSRPLERAIEERIDTLQQPGECLLHDGRGDVARIDDEQMRDAELLEHGTLGVEARANVVVDVRRTEDDERRPDPHDHGRSIADLSLHCARRVAKGVLRPEDVLAKGRCVESELARHDERSQCRCDVPQPYARC